MSDIPIPRVVPKELFLGPQLFIHGFLGIDVLLTPSYDSDETQLERVDSTRQDVEGVRSGVHQIEFR